MMCRRNVFVLMTLGVLAFAMNASAGIIYVDATHGDTGNTTLAAGGVWEPVDVGSGGSGADGLWRVRYGYANDGTIYESRGDWAGNNTEDCPRLKMTVDVPLGEYDVYAYMWTAGTAGWLMEAALSEDLPRYACNSDIVVPELFAPTQADAGDFADPVPMVTEADRTIWQIYLGNTGETTQITVYIDDWAGSDPASGGNERTWFDGIGYVPEPATIALLGLGGLALLRRKR